LIGNSFLVFRNEIDTDQGLGNFAWPLFVLEDRYYRSTIELTHSSKGVGSRLSSGHLNSSNTASNYCDRRRQNLHFAVLPRLVLASC